ncbi:hypothetical protein MMC20_007636 [Loxospora ochrophaea]|nr:hypothetical protein [Loxospora ochrophaea]
MGDTARFVNAALDLKEWNEESGMAGSEMSLRKVVSVAERVTGRKFLVKENSVEEMEEMAKEPKARFSNQARIGTAKGGARVTPSLNEKLREIKPVGLEEWLQKWWGGVDLPESSWGTGTILIIAANAAFLPKILQRNDQTRSNLEYIYIT